MSCGPTGCRAAQAGSVGTGPGIEEDAPAGGAECPPVRYDVDGYALLSCSPMVDAETVSRLFSENRPGLFLRLLQQVRDRGYEVASGMVGVQGWQAQRAAYHPLATRAVEQLPSNLARALSTGYGGRTQLYVERLGYRDPLDEVRQLTLAALSLPPSANKHKALSVTPLVIALRQDPSDPARVVVEIADWMREGRIVWTKSYDARDFREEGVAYESLDGERLLRRIVEDVRPALAANRIPEISDVAGILQGGVGEIAYYVPELVVVVE